MDSQWEEYLENLEDVFKLTSISPRKFIQMTLIFSECKLNNKPDDFFLRQYKVIAKYLEDHLEIIEEETEKLTGESFLHFYVRKWEDYQCSSNYLNLLCVHLNEWIKTKTLYYESPLENTYRNCIISWQRYFFRPLVKKISNHLLEMIEKRRRRQICDPQLIKSAIALYLEPGYNSDETDCLYSSFLELYNENFEPPYLAQLEQYYTEVSDDLIERYSVTEYLEWASKKLLEETSLFQFKFNKSTLKQLHTNYTHIVIRRHINVLYAGFPDFLKNCKYEDLARLLCFIAGMPEELEELHRLFESHVHEEGSNAIRRCSEFSADDPILYISTILEVYHKYHELVKKIFNSDVSFVKAFDKATEMYINENEITKIANDPKKSTELLARYFDYFLKKSSRHSDGRDFEESLSRVMEIIKYFHNDDAFEEYYHRMLSSRLLQQTSVSHDAELDIISKLKNKLAFGMSFQTKFETMFKDVEQSRILEEEFKIYLNNTNELIAIDLSVQILTMCSWIISKSVLPTLPNELERAVDIFTKFYQSRHKNRILTWQHQISKVEIKFNCFHKVYHLTTSTYQTAILLQFNSTDSLSVHQLQESTGIDMEMLQKVLQTLIKCKLLVSEQDNLEPDSIVTLNLKYNNKKLRVNINIPIKPDVKKEQQETEQNIMMKRKFIIEAAIVRIMKARKRLYLQQLIAELLSQLRFKLEVTLIKKTIKKLVDRQYLEETNEKDVYDYLA